MLEAAHIQPFAANGSDDVSNGLLLRSDIHVLFDSYLLSINPDTHLIYCSKRFRNTEPYAGLHKRPANLPSKPEHQPAKLALVRHYETTKG